MEELPALAGRIPPEAPGPSANEAPASSRVQALYRSASQILAHGSAAIERRTPQPRPPRPARSAVLRTATMPRSSTQLSLNAQSASQSASIREREPTGLALPTGNRLVTAYTALGRTFPTDARVGEGRPGGSQPSWVAVGNRPSPVRGPRSRPGPGRARDHAGPPEGRRNHPVTTCLVGKCLADAKGIELLTRVTHIDRAYRDGVRHGACPCPGPRVASRVGDDPCTSAQPPSVGGLVGLGSSRWPRFRPGRYLRWPAPTFRCPHGISPPTPP